ncbi:MAG: Wzz/FepE/Etk N-terminal domain-containing protein, partial [Candidatus Bipolaricaulia bacterium]
MEDEVRDPYEYEVDLRDYIKVIWQQKWIIALVFVIAIGAALAFSLSTKPKYSTQASLIVTSSLADRLIYFPGEPQGKVDFISKFDPKEVGFSEKLLKTLKSKVEPTDAGDRKAASSLKNRMSVSLTEPGGSKAKLKKPTITLTVTGQNRTRIKEITNKWAQLYVNRATPLLFREIDRYKKLISKKYSRVQEELKAKINQRIKARQKYNLQSLEIEIDALQNKYKEFLASLESAKLRLEKKKAKLTSLKSALEDEPRYLYLERSMPLETFRNTDKQSANQSEDDKADNQGESQGGSSELAQVKTQKINEVFTTFKEKKIATEVDIASLEKEVDYLSSKIDEFRRKIREKQALVDRAQFELGKLDRAINRLRYTSSNSLYTHLQKARRAGEEETPIRVLNEADSVKTLQSVDTRQN